MRVFGGIEPGSQTSFTETFTETGECTITGHNGTGHSGTRNDGDLCVVGRHIMKWVG